MTGVLQTIGVVLLAAAGVLLGRAFSRLKSRAWAAGYLLPLAAVLMIVAARRAPRLTLVFPFSWIMAGRTEFALLGLSATLMLTTPLSRLKGRTLRRLVVLFMCFAVMVYAVVPFVQPLLLRGMFARMRSRTGAGGVCLQSTGYTCGPAAAVTALGLLGFEATEGELAIRSHTSAVAGTPADLLCAAMRAQFGPRGLRCQYRAFNSVDELRTAGVVMAEINLSLTMDHWVVVLDLTADRLVLGDPACGPRTVTRQQFRRMWRRTGIVLTRAARE